MSLMSLPNMPYLDKEVQATPEKPEAVTLRDGSIVTIRPIRPDDARRLQGLFARLSPESISFRFLGHPKELPGEQAEQLANVDYHTRMALVATREQGGEEHIIAVARYAVDPAAGPDLAEAAVVVEDEYQNRGLGTLLLKRLVAYAQTHGIRAFMATVRHDNVRIMRFIRRSGLPTESKLAAGAWEILVKLEPEADR
jgi:RimJ/RimL family protein N-acetyltransferase